VADATATLAALDAEGGSSMNRADTAAHLAMTHDAATLAQAAAARLAAEILARTPGPVPDDALSAVLGSFGLLVLRAIAEAAPERLSEASRARLAAVERQADQTAAEMPLDAS
jgi:hypothetical protein